MKSSELIRLGIIRCDSHAYHFGIFLDKVDPAILSSYSRPDAVTRESVHHYFKKIGNPTKIEVQPIPGFAMNKVFDRVKQYSWGTYPGRATAFCETFQSHPQICETLEELLVDVDAVFLADSSSPFDGADHLELSRPFLENGIPIFVDKPFAASVADAQEMIRLARQHHTPLLNASILSHCDVGKQFRRRFDEIGEPGLLVVKGCGPSNSAVGHGLALALQLFGYGVQWVRCMGSVPLEYIQLHYPDGRQAVVMNTSHDIYPRTSEFYASAYSKMGVIHCPGIGDWQFGSGTRRIVELFKQMIETGEPPTPYEHMIEPIAIIEAAKLAQKMGDRVALSDVCDASMTTPKGTH